MFDFDDIKNRKKQHKYTLFIDESGESGISNVRTETSKGASPYMTLGGAIVRNDSFERLQNSLAKVQKEFGKNSLHCSELNHSQKVHYAKVLAQMPIRLFGVISYKKTLGSYKEQISDNHNSYYNKCAQYLLERVGWFMENREINADDLDIVFEESGADYAKMKNLIRKCQSNPIQHMSEKLKFIDPEKYLI